MYIWGTTTPTTTTTATPTTNNNDYMPAWRVKVASAVECLFLLVLSVLLLFNCTTLVYVFVLCMSIVHSILPIGVCSDIRVSSDTFVKRCLLPSFFPLYVPN